MDMAEYLELRRYDAVEPLSVTYAMDRLAALQRCEYASVHGVRKSPRHFLVFDKMTQAEHNAEIMSGLQRMGFKKHGA